MIQVFKIRRLLSLAFCVAMVLSVAARAQSKRMPTITKERLLATLAVYDGDVPHLLSLWQVPLAVSAGQNRIKTDSTGKPQGLEIAPNTAFVLLDGTLANPFAGNLVWVLKVYESTLPQDIASIAGSLAWDSGQQQAYVSLSRSGASWDRLQVFQTNLKQVLGNYSPAATPRDDSVLNSAPSNTKAFAEWKTDSLRSMGLLQATAVQSVIEPRFLLIQLLDGISLKTHSSLEGKLYLRLNLKDGTFSKVASE